VLRAFAPRSPTDSTWLRSSPTPEGRCCAEGDDELVVAALPVAILTDPGGSVLPVGQPHQWSPEPLTLRSSPTPEGRCCCHAEVDRLARDTVPVAILTDPGGSVLPTSRSALP